MPTEPCIDAPDVAAEVRLELFRLMLLQRHAEERIMALYRQGRIVGSVYTGYQQEAVGAGAGLALGPDDVVLPLNREQACHYARGVPVAHVLRNFLGKATGPTFGRDGNMHFGVPERGVFPLVSMLGDLCPVAVGAALAFKRRGEPRIALTFFGDGAMSTGDVHEALNLAGVLQVPVVFVVQSNQYAYSTPTGRQTVNTNLAERMRGGGASRASRSTGPMRSPSSGPRAPPSSGRAAAAGRRRSRRCPFAATDMPHTTTPATSRPTCAPASRTRSSASRSASTPTGSRRPTSPPSGSARAEVVAAVREAEAAPAPDPSTLEHGVYATPIAP